MNKAIPTDPALYNKIKNHYIKKNQINSAYRSAMIVKSYKKQFRKKHGNNLSYKNKKNNQSGLTRWFNEKWSSDKEGNVMGYEKKSDIYRPQIRVNKNTPVTWSELTEKEINKARTTKKEKGRVTRFKIEKLSSDKNTPVLDLRLQKNNKAKKEKERVPRFSN